MVKIPFQDESKLPKALDGETPIRQGSVGINNILGLLIKGSTEHRTVRWDNYVINAFTLFRNVYNDKLTTKELENLFLEEYNILVSYLTSYISYFKTTHKYPIILFFPIYNVPTMVKRTPSKAYTKLYTEYIKIYRKHNNLFEPVSENEHLIQFIIDAGNSLKLPYKEVVTKLTHIAKYYKNIRIYSTDKMFLLSNCLLDLYIHKAYSNVELVECYTAKLKTYKDFGSKLTDKVNIPFIWETHRLFGDKYHIAPLVQRAEKTKIIETATKNKWIIKNINFICNDIVKTLNCPTTVFSSFKP